MAYYYPEGYFGPICDTPLSDDQISSQQRDTPAFDEGEEERVQNYPAEGNSDIPWWFAYKDITGDLPSVLISTRCKQREDGSFFDCEYEYASPVDFPEINVPQEDFGLGEQFFVPVITPESCSPFDADINILPISFITPSGGLVTKYKKEKSSPVTYAVTSTRGFTEVQSDLDVSFNDEGTQVIVTGTGSAIVTFELRWDDDPGTSGLAVGTLTIEGQSVSQSGEEGSTAMSVQLSSGTYPISLSGESSGSGSRTRNNNKTIEYDDDIDEDGFDVNATLSIQSVDNIDGIQIDSFWSDEGNAYAVWTNPETCTLPREEQDVTYKIPIPTAGTYGFTFASDDGGTVIINENDTIFNNLPGGIFKSGSLSTPYSATRNLDAGILEMTVRCTNSDAGFTTDGEPSGLAYAWWRNPGGWYIKICKGGTCAGETIVPWVRSGPHQLWSEFMNNYAVYTSNTEPSLGTHTTSYTIYIDEEDDYLLEMQADNNGTISWDGTQVLTSSSYTTSSTYTIPNVSVGPHTLSVSVTNVANGGTDIDTWGNNPGGIAWTLTQPSDTVTTTETVTTETPNEIQATFNSDGDIVVTGFGTGRIQLIFEWDDDPNRYGTALGSIEIAGKTFVQTTGKERGNDSYTFTARAGRTYTAVIEDNPSGFTRKRSNTRLCFFDSDDDDCNAKLDIASVTYSGTVSSSSTDTNTTTIEESIIARSTDLNIGSNIDNNNLIWHTRLATGYEYSTTQ
ncbi:hypothetical protein SXCG_00094 [Synechococcus phage S-CAM8]|uniref:PA14 domain-containing protein n=1 Tax=Synechococcus phage S-CAM8 TaxID=754038 RepID=R9TRB2_9CAUD|nr:major head protein [Synechococcus phage S-CAM8]AGN34034.1 hypothetical protein SXCG_00094 [Synechococcus phage S-CAM8]